MNERLKELAEQAGFIGGIHNLKGHRVFYWDDDITEQIERFAELIRADEREACAITAWYIGLDLYLKHHDTSKFGSACATAIRQRGEK